MKSHRSVCLPSWMATKTPDLPVPNPKGGDIRTFRISVTKDQQCAGDVRPFTHLPDDPIGRIPGLFAITEWEARAQPQCPWSRARPIRVASAQASLPACAYLSNSDPSVSIGQGSYCPARVILPRRRHLAVSGDIFGCHTGSEMWSV